MITFVIYVSKQDNDIWSLKIIPIYSTLFSSASGSDGTGILPDGKSRHHDVYLTLNLVDNEDWDINI